MKINERMTIEEYLHLDYPVTVYRAPEEGYVVEIEDLPGCLTQGETIDEALRNIDEARRGWIGAAFEDGTEIPLPRTEHTHSGKFLVRMDKSLHRHLVEQAYREGTSLNQHVVTLLAIGSTLNEVVPAVERATEAAFQKKRFLVDQQEVEKRHWDWILDQPKVGLTVETIQAA